MTEKEKELTEMLKIAQQEIKDHQEIRDDLQSKLLKANNCLSLIEANVRLTRNSIN